MYKSFTSLVKLAPRCFSILDATVNGTVFLNFLWIVHCRCHSGFDLQAIHVSFLVKCNLSFLSCHIYISMSRERGVLPLSDTLPSSVSLTLKKCFTGGRKTTVPEVSNTPWSHIRSALLLTSCRLSSMFHFSFNFLKV